MKRSLAWMAAAAAAWFPAVTGAAQAAGPDAVLKLARTEARAAYTEALGMCRQHASEDVQQCRTEARRQYQADLERAREHFVAAKQMQPLVTPKDHFRNDRREAWAAYEEAKTSCQQMKLDSRTACMDRARRRFNLEMLEAKATLERARLAQASSSGQRNTGASNSGVTAGEAGFPR